ncbi:MAG: methyltransferase domain-containing protein [Bryobacteraceae bacterium]
MTEAALLDWFRSGEDPWLSWEQTIELIHATHPRVMFVKSLPRRALLLDMGAGDGSLQIFREWLKPARPDLRFYAYAMDMGASFDRYDRYEIGEWPAHKPSFDGQQFDAIVACHFIEHIPDPLELIAWMASRLRSGGRVYIEWPSENSKHLPSRRAFRAAGIPIDVSNFLDDLTHKDLPPREMVVEGITRQNLIIDQSGAISNPFLEQEVLAHFKHGCDAFIRELIFALQSTLWSRTKWAQYVIASKE